MLMFILGILVIILIVFKVICVGEDEEFVVYMFSFVFFFNGICIIFMNVVGVRYVCVFCCDCD